MSYDYVKRTYHVQPVVGHAVRHKATGQFGFITRENPGQGHYVQVRFSTHPHATPCHPLELDYDPQK
jgi:hypothetical protein